VISEADVALTDFALTLECGVFASLLPSAGPETRWLGRFFAATALASVAGGVVHGFYPETTAFSRVLWAATLLAIGAAALCAWAAGAYILAGARVARWLVATAGIAFAAYALIVVRGAEAFVLAIYAYAPAALFLLIAFGVLFGRTRARPALAGVVGLALTFVAAWVQQAHVTMRTGLSHNALYHLIQGAALALIFVCARWIARREAC
jgi:Family of unknown function (DUF6962)